MGNKGQKLKPFRVCTDERGIAALELAVLLPLILIMSFAVIDFGRLIQAKLVITNLRPEGGTWLPETS